MKKCQKCKRVKSLEEFHRNSKFADGRAERCKLCRKTDSKNHYQQRGEHIKARMRKYYHNGGKEIAQIRHRRPEVQDADYALHKTPKYKRKARANRRKESTKKAQREHYKSMLDKRRFKAYAAVKAAIKAGKLKDPENCNCSMCSKHAVLYHHHSYDKQYWLDVIPLCERCHHRGHHSLIEIPISY